MHLQHALVISPATILQTMRNDGNVLVAVDTAGRMLELAQLLVRRLSTVWLLISSCHGDVDHCQVSGCDSSPVESKYFH